MDSTAAGIVVLRAQQSVDAIVARVRTLLEQRQITLFAVIDHSGEAAKAGLAMPATKLLIFGSPKAGTPVMLAAPSAAIDLPLKLLVYEKAGEAFVAYNDPAYLQARHAIPQELIQNLQAVALLAQKAAE